MRVIGFGGGTGESQEIIVAVRRVDMAELLGLRNQYGMTLSVGDKLNISLILRTARSLQFNRAEIDAAAKRLETLAADMRAFDPQKLFIEGD